MDNIDHLRRDAAASSIRTLRTRLLDLTRTNPLISFNHAKARGTRTNLRAVDIYINVLFEQIADGRDVLIHALPPVDDEPADERTQTFADAVEIARQTDMAFQDAIEALAEDELNSPAAARAERELRDRVRQTLAMPQRQPSAIHSLAEHAAAHGIDPSFELRVLPSGHEEEGRTVPAIFQALLLPDPLQQTIAKIRDTAKTYEEEIGVNTLHLAFGFLEWFESETSEKPIFSPLVVVPVALGRNLVRGRYQYVLTSAGDDPEVNLTLSERLNRDFLVRLPDLKDGEQIENYLLRVTEDVCKGRKRWRTHRFVTLAQFPFARLAMFNDLDEATWTQNLAEHPLLGQILGGSGSNTGGFAEEHDVDSPVVSAKVPLMALEADASQHSAVYDVMSGKNLVIQGPPGTGKSQTITNIIVAALATNKTVLFMAEKQAALQVVKDRLDHVGLGDFCLELHSSKAKKAEVAENLRRRMDRRPSAATDNVLQERVLELEARRQSLNDYVAILNAPLGNFGATVHDILWADRRRRSDEGAEARELDAIVIENTASLSATDIETRKALLVRFENAAKPVLEHSPDLKAHPWFGMTRASLSSIDFDEALRAFGDATETLERCEAIASKLSECDVSSKACLPDIERTARTLVNLPVTTDIDAALFSGVIHETERCEATAWIPLCRTYAAAVDRLRYWGNFDSNSDWQILANCIDEVLNCLDVETASELTIEGIYAWAADQEIEGQRLSDLGQTAKHIASAFGCAAPRDFGDVEVLLASRLHVRALDSVAIGAISPALVARNATETVEEAAAAIRKLIEQAEELDGVYQMQSAPSPEELRQAATTLREAGLLSFLSATVKQATRTYESLQKTPGRASRPEMAAALIGIADHLDAVNALKSHADYKLLFGDRFRGLETDVQTAASVAKWAACVRADMLRRGDSGAQVREVLLRGDPDGIEAISAALTDIRAREEELVLPAHTDRTAALAEVTAGILQRAKGAIKFADDLLKAGIRATVEVRELVQLADLFRQIDHLQNDASCPKSLITSLEENMPSPLADMAPLERAVAAANAVAMSDLAPNVREHLLGVGPALIVNSFQQTAAAFLEASQTVPEQFERVRSWFGLDDNLFFGAPTADLGIGVITQRMRTALNAVDTLGDWVTYLIERVHLLECGLGELLDIWDKGILTTPLSAAFDRALYRNLAREAITTYPILDRHTGLAQEEARARFHELDQQVAKLRREKLADDLTRKPVPQGIGVGKKSDYTEEALLANETSKQKRHIPLRQLLDRAGNAIQALKPCFMMSPLSVAQYLKADGLRFDLLVIDEASQMLPEDALGAIARATQFVVVGDPMQLPPTNFFGGRDDSDIDDDDAEENVDAESILDLARGVFRPTRRLRVHYRSRHGSLIAFSNRRFYDNDLIVFPSPADIDETRGVSLVKVDGLYKARSNLIEAEAVCEAAVEHMRNHPDRSMGIATMNGVQRDLILQRMDQLAAQHEEVEAYRARWADTLERFFVKNLETVQGDERDTILISTVFGPPEPGQRVRQSFGPLNGAAGHRRLNVLFTRAKHHIRVFTSMTPDDITGSSNPLSGAQVLKDYLAYAATGRLDAGEETGKEADSDFEVFVRDRLRLAGYDAVPQVGVAGFFIDLAVRDPDVPGSFLVGIECDGASYHSSRSARDRDILRQQVLEGLGWSIYRIWSTDWFRDPAGQTRKMVAAIEELRACRK